ncbi:11851_t:CDS:10 [Funneliformis caledonium]|uniref:11851_t:CDS:1 n=1 Tax=Funneliformis caledonium TaxID=1117310 RepID=A0A9N9HKE5_9GLOM|nr:11851_t:CDS:10 [Funneliformis caledonium]
MTSASPRVSIDSVPKLKLKQRCVISKMILNNFKSNFGKQEIGPFNESFSAVVGQNNSGKSNVIDAFLFVFGNPANKMNQAKLSELIHSSQGCENLNDCSVDIYFEEILDLPGSDNYEILTQSQLVISRQAFRNNTSKYFINGRQSDYIEVTNLLKTKPKALVHEDELLEYIEDVIGTFKYKVSLEEASEKFETLDEDQSEKLNCVKIVEKEKQSLEAKKKDAKDYLRDENTLPLKQSALYQKKFLECKINTEISTNAVVAELANYEREKKKHAISKQKKFTMAISKDRHGLSEAKTAIRFNEQNLEVMVGLEKSLKAQEKELEKIRQILEAEEDAVTFRLRESYLKKKLEILSIKNQIDDKKLEIQQLDTDIKHYLSKFNSILADFRERDDETKKLLEASQSREQVLSSLIKLKDSGRIKGIYDRLGNLGVIDDKYDVAISNAFPALNSIIVDSAEVGLTCIEYLKRNNLGYATFIPLKELPTMDMRPIPTPENVPRLFDLIRPKDDMFIPAFYNVLQDTLVAQNLKQAIRIAFGKTQWSVMTLRGELVGKNGTLSFGSDIVSEKEEKLKKERFYFEMQKEFNEKFRPLQSKLQEKKDQLSKLKFELSKIKMEANACAKRIKIAEYC